MHSPTVSALMEMSAPQEGGSREALLIVGKIHSEKDRISLGERIWSAKMDKRYLTYERPKKGEFMQSF